MKILLIILVLFVGCNNSTEPKVYGCTDSTSCNFDINTGANVDDGTCLENDCAGYCGGDGGENDGGDDGDGGDDDNDAHKCCTILMKNELK